MTRQDEKQFLMQCAKASDNKLINIALDEIQKMEQDEDMDPRRVQTALEEMERRGLDAQLVQGSNEDFDFEHVA